MDTFLHPPIGSCKHVKLNIDGPGSRGEVILKNLGSDEITNLERIALLWNEANPLHSQPVMTVEVL